MTETDIGFDGSCNLDTTTLLSFCAGTTCYVVKWYDQSGNGNDATAFAGDSNGPPIVNGGLVISTLNGHTVSGNYPAATYLRNSVGGMVGTGQGSIFAVAQATSGGAGSSVAGWFNQVSMIGMASLNNNGCSINWGCVQGGSLYNPPSINFERYQGSWLGAFTDMNDPVTYSYGSSAILAMRWNTSDIVITKGYINGGTPGTENTVHGNDAPVDVRIGTGGGANSSAFTGFIAEFMTFSTELSISDANILGANQGTYWNLTWTTITT
jgi:hypothetical protein